jgi:hypothetical protein
MLPAASPFLNARPVPDPANAKNAYDDAGNLSVALNQCNFDKDAAKVEWNTIRNFYAGEK